MLKVASQCFALRVLRILTEAAQLSFKLLSCAHSKVVLFYSFIQAPLVFPFDVKDHCVDDYKASF